GEYAGFDEREPTSETGGKARAIEGIRQQHGFSSVVMVGDGVTDLEAKGPADMVIGFGGNVVRERVAQEADWFVRSFAELLDARTQADDTEVGVRA
ncbi:pxPhosphoserine phosphatase, partial [Acanthamoeba castellanii str. Neff]